MVSLPMTDSCRAVLQRPGDGAWTAFDHPARVLEAHDIGQVLQVLAEVEKAAAGGATAVGYLSYEAASAFDPALTTRAAAALPFAWFAVFGAEREIAVGDVAPERDEPRLDWKPSVDLTGYRRSIDRIHQWIAAGDTYQVNYTLRLRSPFSGSAADYFHALVRHGGSRYGAFLDTGRHVLCSLSPELFFRLDGDRLVTRPMKGTTERGRTTQEDTLRARELRDSVKNRAENVMIVDMMRNDLGRIARPGTVQVSELWEVERYPTLFQLTSTCRASTDASVSEVLAALFPSASITGAPKVRTMERIAELETTPRGIYTGAIGRIGPGRSACFNVAIRTVHIDRERRTAEYGTGGGIVWDSVAEDEYEEARTKALVVTSPPPEFALLETLRWSPREGYVLLERHLDRLFDSAAYFGRRVDRDLLMRQLEAAVRGKRRVQRVRLLVTRDGTLDVRADELIRKRRRWTVVLAREPIDSDDRFLFHKTTHRAVYDSARVASPDVDDVLLWNTRGEITESTVANVVVRRDGELVTPPVECGLLPGTARAELIERRRVREKIVLREELEDVQALYLVNSVRGWLPTVLKP
jgi:para-aminobenzoate synthetase/4-amino-4-deoxychorismate lyase